MRRCARSSMRRRTSPSTTRSPTLPNSTPIFTAEARQADFGAPMPIEVLMPALSPTMEKGNLAKWLKKEGDSIKSGDIIAEIETDKATMEVEAADEGTLGRILVPEGTADVAVNTPIAVILSDGEDKSSIKDAKLSPLQEAAESARPFKAEKTEAKIQNAPAPKSPNA